MAAPSSTDFIPAFDPTAYTSITGAQLLQYLSGAYPYTDKGMAILTTDVAGVPEVPDAATTTKWKRYLWIRQSATLVGLYVWNENAADDATYLKWQSINIAGIGAGSIVNSMIQDNTILDAKIANLDYSKLLNAPTPIILSSAATGDLLGSTYASLAIAPLAITTSKLNDQAVTTAKIADLNVTYGKLAGNGTAGDILRVNTATTGMEFYTSKIATSGVVVPTANSLKVPQVNVGATDFQMVAPTTLGRILQIVQVEYSTITTSSGALTNATSTPNYNSTGCTALFNSGAFAKIDTTGTSKLLIEAWVPVYDNNVDTVFVGLYNATGATAPLAGACASMLGSVSSTFAYISYLTAANPTNATYYINFGSTGSGTTKSNTVDGANNNYGVMKSIIRITEYI